MKEKMSYVKGNLITWIFLAIVLISLLVTDQAYGVIAKDFFQTLAGYMLLTFALVIPLKMKMGLNFGLIVGAMIGQIALIWGVSQGMSPITTVMVSVAISILFSCLLGYVMGVLLNLAKGHEMITSFFFGQFFKGIYQYILLFLFGGFISVKVKEILLSSGVGLKNTLDLKRLLFNEPLLEVSLSSFIVLIALSLLIYFVVQMIQSKSYLSLAGIIATGLGLVFGLWSSLVEILPVKLMYLKSTKISLMSYIIVFFIILIYELLIKNKFVVTNDEMTDELKKKRIQAIMISTVLASIGQMILLIDMGFMMTFGSYYGSLNIAMIAIIIGGASLKKVSTKHAVSGIIVYQAFLLVTTKMFVGNISGVIQMILINGLYVYMFVGHYFKKIKESDSIEEKHAS